MSYKSPTQPRCRYCGTKIRKYTHNVYFGRDTPSLSDFSTNRPETPMSKEAAQRMLNGHVVSVRWSRGEDYFARKAGGDFICQASTWDGESYEDEFFCNGEHAKRFAYLLAREGRCTRRYNDAVATDTPTPVSAPPTPVSAP